MAEVRKRWVVAASPEAGRCPGLTSPPQPLVRDPLAAQDHGASCVVHPGVETPVGLDVEPKDSVTLHRGLANPLS